MNIRIAKHTADRVPYAAYVGRTERVGRQYKQAMYILSNPYRIGRDGSREEVVAKYRRWLWEHIREEDWDVMHALEDLKLLHDQHGQLVLVCHCCNADLTEAPANYCHATVIGQALEWLYGDKQADVEPKPRPRVIVAGSRSFGDYELLAKTLDALHEEIGDFELVSGTAHGADRLGEQWAKARGLSVKRFPADWEKYGRGAGYRRNEQMAQYATHLVAFWDGQSKGTAHMIGIARSLNLTVQVVRFGQPADGPRIVREDLWQHPGFPGMIVVTTNWTIKRNGALVMGAGAALEAKKRIHGIDFECGEAIREFMEREGHARYEFLVIRPPTEKTVGFAILQTKMEWRDPAHPLLIEGAVRKLAEYARQHPDVQIRVNYPGIGRGGLKRERVAPLLTVLPQNVTVCYR